MYIYYNPNPRGDIRSGDCVIRALAKACNLSWEETYLELSMLGFRMGDMPSANHVWSEFLRSYGFNRFSFPNTCPACYTVRDFCIDHPRGLYVLATGSHVVTVIDGDYYDSWDSGDEVPAFFFKKEDERWR